MPAGDLVEVARYPRLLRLMGAWFTLCGLVPLYLLLTAGAHGGVTVSDGQHTRPAARADAWMPCLVIGLGLGLALVRYRVVLEPLQRQRVRSWGWGLWTTRTATPLPAMTSVDIGDPEGRGSGSGAYTAIPVTALGPSGKNELSYARTRARATALARRIADAFQVPLGPRSQEQDRPLDRT